MKNKHNIKNTWGHFIAGQEVFPANAQYLTETDPRYDTPSFRITAGSPSDVDQAVRDCQSAQPAWAQLKPLERGRVLTQIALQVRAQSQLLARVEQIETGKSLTRALQDIEMVAQYFEYYGGLAPSVEGETISMGPNRLSYTLKEPYGVIGIILPWNAPANQAARAIAPALAVGNAVIIKPSEFTSVSSLILADIACQAGLPAGLFNVVTGDGIQVGQSIVDHSGVGKIAFTGSLRAGKIIGQRAAARVIPVTLELGGKSPDIVFDDADLALAAKGVLQGFTVNSGQACIAGTRVLVQRSIHDRFLELIQQEASRIAVGDADEPEFSPIITKMQYHKILEYFDIARKEKVNLVCGGAPFAGYDGFFVQPTIYSNVAMNSPLVTEEIFGPVCVIIPFETVEQAIAIANDTNFGLAAGLWTQSLSTAHRVAACLQAGQVYVNEYPGGGIETPFGGYKQSGIGKEKGQVALSQYIQIKSVTLKL